MKGLIYIASAFQNLKTTGCIIEGEVDNDPHVWTKPYTWGICRPDLREKVSEGDYVFFVLGANANLPQMVFSYIRIKEIITHFEAYFNPELRSKRMSNKKFKGNIIVDENGNYNRYDLGIHKNNFERIKQRYVIADMNNSSMLSNRSILTKSEKFLETLKSIFNISSDVKAPINLISRYGKPLSYLEVNKLLYWLKN